MIANNCVSRMSVIDNYHPIVLTKLMTPETEARLRAASVTERDAAIRQARLEGATLKQIADVVGMTPPGVLKIINKETTE